MPEGKESSFRGRIGFGGDALFRDALATDSAAQCFARQAVARPNLWFRLAGSIS